MKSLVAISFILLTAASCTATRPPLDEDSIDAGRVNPALYRPSGTPNAPVSWEDSIDAGRVNPAWRRPSRSTDQVAQPASNPGACGSRPVAGGN